MIPSATLPTLEPDRADDVFLVANSFEDRCLESTRRAEQYQARCAILVNFLSQTDLEGERRKRANLDILIGRLQRIDESHVPRLVSVGHHDYVSRLTALAEELRWRDMGDRLLTVTLDISCLTRSQMVFLTKACIEELSSEVRFIYTMPRVYNTRGERLAGLTRGYLEPVPLTLRAGGGESLGPVYRVALAVVGHEGQRSMSAWRG